MKNALNVQAKPQKELVASEIPSQMVRLSSVTTRFSVNPCKCGLDPWGKDTLASTPATDQQAFLCTPGGSVSAGKRQVLHLTCAVRTNPEKVAQDSRLFGNVKMPRYS